MMIERAIEVFVRGFSFTRSFTHPYLAERIHPRTWVLRDAPRARADYRGEEYVATGVSAADLDALAWRHTRGRFKICVMQASAEPDMPIRQEFRALGYRLMATESLMLHQLAVLTPVVEPYPVVRITTEAQATLLAQAARSRQILPEHLAADPAPMRQYMTLDGPTPVGWVGSVVVDDCAWCTNMFVAPSHRRQGIARALLTRMLADDQAGGARANILLASHAGAKLYPAVGYETIGRLLIFAPPRSAARAAPRQAPD
jgi:GNAT superfamily N-acetyltransferase